MSFILLVTMDPELFIKFLALEQIALQTLTKFQSFKLHDARSRPSNPQPTTAPLCGNSTTDSQLKWKK